MKNPSEPILVGGGMQECPGCGARYHASVYHDCPEAEAPSGPTRAPWGLHILRGGEEYAIRAPNGSVVACLGHASDCNNLAANARLIAAAPALLAALQALAFDDNVVFFGCTGEKGKAILSQARAAIALATGGAK